MYRTKTADYFADFFVLHIVAFLQNDVAYDMLDRNEVKPLKFTKNITEHAEWLQINRMIVGVEFCGKRPAPLDTPLI